MIFIELNTFLMMNSFGVPHDSLFNALRLAVMGFLSIPAVAEFYHYVEQTSEAKSDNARIGPATWLVLTVAVLEVSGATSSSLGDTRNITAVCWN